MSKEVLIMLILKSKLQKNVSNIPIIGIDVYCTASKLIEAWVFIIFIKNLEF